MSLSMVVCKQKIIDNKIFRQIAGIFFTMRMRRYNVKSIAQ